VTRRTLVHCAAVGPGLFLASAGAGQEAVKYPEHVAEEFPVQVRGQALLVQLLSPPPDRRAPHPALLLSLAVDRRTTLFGEPYAIPACHFLHHGHRVVSFSLPCHGERVAEAGEGIAGFCALLVAGRNPFAELVEEGRAVLDECLRRGAATPGRIAVCGVSRGGYCALRLAAAEKRIQAVAGYSPVTDWRVLREFAEAREQPVVAEQVLDRFAGELAGRAVFVAIGNRDARVGTECAARFAARILEEEARRGAESSRIRFLVVDDSRGHGLHERWRQQGAEFLLETVTRT